MARVRTIKDLLKELRKIRKKRLNKKRWFPNTTKVKKSQRKIIRNYQKLHNGRHPQIKMIPNGYYCYNNNGRCPFYFMVQIQDDDSNDIVENIAKVQNYIGGCKLLNLTDIDLEFGLLWDDCKECSFNIKHERLRGMDNNEKMRYYLEKEMKLPKNHKNREFYAKMALKYANLAEKEPILRQLEG